ncbi:MAG: hypothetical protein HY898_31095 [Deltaproteobacteria bacterium]|nr:hypothetical protein [Deltaproteobacteria bacterium]
MSARIGVRPSSRMPIRHLAALVCALVWLIGCGDDTVRVGTLRGIPLQLGPLGYAPTASLAVSAPIDLRPAIEHEGDSIHTRLFFTTGIVTYWSRRGNYITDDQAATPLAVSELQTAMIDALRSANVATAVVPAGQTEFTLETEIEHLYGTHYAINEGTVVVIEGNRSANAGVFTGSRQYASYGNVILKARLVDHRGPQPFTLWEEHVVGFGQQEPTKKHVISAQTALREAVADALSTLVVRVGAALDRIQRGPTGPTYHRSGQLPPVFLIERVSRYRNFLERVYIDTASARVLRHEIVPLADAAWGRPGEWLLSRRSPEGIVLSPESYEAYAHALATKYDLRTVDDAYRYHFFGYRGAAVGPVGSVSPGDPPAPAPAAETAPRRTDAAAAPPAAAAVR